jgi:hypothetical protein
MVPIPSVNTVNNVMTCLHTGEQTCAESCGSAGAEGGGEGSGGAPYSPVTNKRRTR